MRREPNPRVDQYRAVHPIRGGSRLGANWGYFVIRCGRPRLQVISSGVDDYHGWEHVSVSVLDESRTPTWEEMAHVKCLFWHEEETVVQFHPKRSEYVNAHPFVLHLWKRVGEEHELPPSVLVGPKAADALIEAAKPGDGKGAGS